MTKKKLNTGRLQFTGVLEADGTVTTERDRIVNRAKEFYEKLYSTNRAVAGEKPYIGQEEITEVPKIEPWEVQHAVKTSKKGKASGPDNVTMDLFEAAGEEIFDKLANLFANCLQKSEVPNSWNEAIIILLFKKGDPKDIANYCPISLLNKIYKLFTKIPHNENHKDTRRKSTGRTSWFPEGFLNSRPPSCRQPVDRKMCRIQNSSGHRSSRLQQSFWFGRNSWHAFGD